MACYCRVATRRQKADRQKADIQRWLTGHAIPPAAVHWFEDVESGITLTRPAFGRMQQSIFLGTITTWWSGNSTGFRAASALGSICSRRGVNGGCASW
jgi:DNA invertase Pin-like site-specific DNA recombinase